MQPDNTAVEAFRAAGLPDGEFRTNFAKVVFPKWWQ